MTSLESSGHHVQSLTCCTHISARLEQLHLSHWTAVVFSWLTRYEGISRCYFEDEEDSPALEVLHCISGMADGSADAEIASALSELEFLTWRIRHPRSQERWDPLACSLIEFIGCETPPDCWRWEGAYPSSPAIALWLLAQLPKR